MITTTIRCHFYRPIPHPAAGDVHVSMLTASSCLWAQTVQQYVSYKFIWIRRTCSVFTTACCLVVGLGSVLGLGLDLVSGGQVVMHKYLCDFRL